MFWKVVKVILLAVLVGLYAYNLYLDRNDLYGAILYNRVNFVLLAGILYLASDYVRACATLCMAVVVGGLLFHGYMYYVTYMGSRDEGNTAQTHLEKCRSSSSSWYSKLNDRCY